MIDNPRRFLYSEQVSKRNDTMDKMPTYTIKIVSEAKLTELNGGSPGGLYGGKTYTGFALVDSGYFTGDYKGMAEGDEVIFLADEVRSAKPES